MTATAPVVLERDGSVAVVTLNRSKCRNALDAAASEVCEVLG